MRKYKRLREDGSVIPDPEVEKGIQECLDRIYRVTPTVAAPKLPDASAPGAPAATRQPVAPTKSGQPEAPLMAPRCLQTRLCQGLPAMMRRKAAGNYAGSYTGNYAGDPRGTTQLRRGEIAFRSPRIRSPRSFLNARQGRWQIWTKRLGRGFQRRCKPRQRRWKPRENKLSNSL